MYQASYGYGPGNVAASAPFNPNGVPQQPPQNPHHQQQPSQQQMMYNPQQQQYGGIAAASHQSPYGTPSPGMGGNAGAMGMMQNNGMAPMGGGHVPTYQTPYSSSPYGGNIPTSTAASLPPNFSDAPFQMNAPNMNLQHQAQRMQPPPTSSTPTQPGQRVSPFAGGQRNTPPNVTAQPQFSTPHAQNLLQTQGNPQGQPILTPQTPTFPQGSQGGGNLATPLSPGSESREKERVTLLLEINKELLLEVIRLQNIQNEGKKEEAAAGAPPDESENDKAEREKERAEKAKPMSRDYMECMRRLQSNLAYLAAIADRSHKPSSQIPAHPAIMFAPPLSPKTTTSTTASPKTESKSETPSEDKKPEKSETEDKKEAIDRSEILKDHYKKLQALFPGVDPKKEPGARPQGQQMMGGGGQGGGQKTALDINAQQKLQNDLLRQKMIQAQMAAQQHAQAQAQNQSR